MSSTSASSIKKLAIRGAIWTIAGYGAGQILRFGSNLILTRLLFPDLFGLMSLVYVFITGLHLFSDIGISTSVIQNKRGDDPEFLNTAWTLQVIRGMGLWICCLIIALPVSQIYNEPRLAWLIPLVGANTVIAGFNSTSLFTLNRHLSVKNLAIYEFLGQLISIVVMLIWAWFNPTIWALVVGGVVSALFQLAWSHRLNSGVPNRFAWDKGAITELVSFGKWIFLSTALTFLATQADRLILGKLFTFELLGVYGVAFTLSDIPRQLMLAVSGKVIFPSYSRLADLPRSEFRAKILRNRGPILIVLALGLAVLVSFGDLIVSVLYDSRYGAAAWMLTLLALGTWPIMLTQTIDSVLFAIGKPRYIAIGCFLSFLCFAIGIPVGFHLLGPVGAVLGVTVSNIPPWAVVAYALWRERLAVIKQDMITTALFVVAIAVLIAGRMALGFGFPGQELFQSTASMM
jgi:O-antigen/teichoic acid export membrane protein